MDLHVEAGMDLWQSSQTNATPRLPRTRGERRGRAAAGVSSIASPSGLLYPKRVARYVPDE